MAIKLPDPGNGIPEQKTGNDEWTNMKIVRDNFADQSNAASRTVGTANGQIPLAEQVLQAVFGGTPEEIPQNLAGTEAFEIDKFEAGTIKIAPRAYVTPTPPYLVNNFISVLTMKTAQLSGRDIKMQLAWGLNDKGFIWRLSSYNNGWEKWEMPYTTGNTTVDSNKNIKTSSPVVRVFSDHLDKIHEANDLPIKYTRNGIGDYTIKGTTGLRENDWQIVIPKDDYDNQLIAFTLKDDNGTIRLKTYKRTFNMTTFMFEPDLNAPLDIPEGRWVDLHFNDLPEQADEPI